MAPRTRVLRPLIGDRRQVHGGDRPLMRDVADMGSPASTSRRGFPWIPVLDAGGTTTAHRS